MHSKSFQCAVMMIFLFTAQEFFYFFFSKSMHCILIPTNISLILLLLCWCNLDFLAYFDMIVKCLCRILQQILYDFLSD